MDSANNRIRTALLSAPSTQAAQVAEIGTTKTGYLIRFKNPKSAGAARNNSEWLNELGNNTKLVKPRFGIVVHRTPTEDFDLENASVQAIETIVEENELSDRGFRIEEVAWLKKKDNFSKNVPIGPMTENFYFHWTLGATSFLLLSFSAASAT